ncbi:hypothetical protein H6P81_002018 [Aristolochia fimbriata]|uniref:Uncharacterized protein n=1 Tax=Aristolochia fimbriata TaxID=158543 RepID=A0AAV7FBC8_ARIFI|nr:hypothetical protein H6P81_002018 [Aristolochia fimbriata]
MPRALDAQRGSSRHPEDREKLTYSLHFYRGLLSTTKRPAKVLAGRSRTPYGVRTQSSSRFAYWRLHN